jgi:hypothetical protein
VRYAGLQRAQVAPVNKCRAMTVAENESSMLCFTRHTVSPVVCVRCVGHGICRLDVRAVLVRRLGYYCQTAAWYHAHRLMKILKEVEASCLHAIKAAASRYCIIGGAVLLQLVHPAGGCILRLGEISSRASGSPCTAWVSTV